MLTSNEFASCRYLRKQNRSKNAENALKKSVVFFLNRPFHHRCNFSWVGPLDSILACNRSFFPQMRFIISHFSGKRNVSRSTEKEEKFQNNELGESLFMKMDRRLEILPTELIYNS